MKANEFDRFERAIKLERKIRHIKRKNEEVFKDDDIDNKKGDKSKTHTEFQDNKKRKINLKDDFEDI